ncbi:MAG: phosphoribosylglycinamide formyltransferase [Bacillota bacterium]
MPGARTRPPLPVVVLVSGQGSNLQAILDRQHDIRVRVQAVISDRPDAPALLRAHKAGAITQTVFPADYPDRAAHDRALADAVDRQQPGLVVLAGYMRILSADFVRRYAGRLLNIHPSLLPKYRGLHTHRRALEAGETVHGCSVHYVIEALDSGAVVAQAEVPVGPGDTETALRLRVQAREHELFPEVIRWFAAGRLKLEGQALLFDGTPLSRPKVFAWGKKVQA